MKHVLTFILIGSIFMACQKEKNSTLPITNNLICNPSFEVDGHGSLNCWNIVKDFTTFHDTFATMAPTNGGKFSLRLEGIRDVHWDPYAETYITNISGQKVISLSAYIMSLLGGQPIYLYLDHIRGGKVIESKSDCDWAFNDWKKFIVTDTLTLQNQDSLRVKIVQTTGQNSSAYIDLVALSIK